MQTIAPTHPSEHSAEANALGLRTLEREVAVDRLPVQGRLPEWLTGTLIRTGPAKFEVGDRSLRHWFDGLAMLHKFSFGPAGVAYANRFLRGRTFEAARRGRLDFGQFATDPCRTLFQRVRSLFSPQLTDNANVNVIRLGEQFMSLTETPIPVVFDPETLDTLGVGEPPPGMLTTAHPHHDAQRGELISYATHLGARSSYRVYARDGSGRQRVIATVPVSRPAYMHSFAMTEQYVVLTEFPLVVNPLALGLGRRPFIESFRWEPERGTRLWVIDRHDGSVRGRYDAPAFFAFHQVNAWEQGEEIVLDVVAYDDARIIDALYLDHLRSGGDIPQSSLRRYRVELNRGSVAEQRVSDEPLELPRIDYRRVNGRQYRYVYAVTAGRAQGRLADGLLKLDVQTGERSVWREGGCYPGEPVFVPAPGATGEDEGVILSIVLDPDAGASRLLVLDAAGFGEIARAEVPHAIPLGFHGSYFR